MLALNGLHTVPGDSSGPDVNGPGAQGVRDYMLKYMGQIFVGQALGSWWGAAFGTVVAGVFGLLLLSAVNTAIGDLVTIQFLMSRDGEMPPVFKSLNRFGVPLLAAVVATVIPLGLVLVVSDMSGLADLYAVGVVGAIATNLGATSTDRKMALGRWERGLMFFTFVIMALIEVSLLIDKPNARYFALTILVCGLVLRELAKERAARRKMSQGSGAAGADASQPPANTARSLSTTSADSTGDPMLCAVRGMGRTLDFALKEAEEIHRPLYLLFVREQSVITGEDRRRKWVDDEEAGRIFHYAKDRVDGKATMLPCYAVSDSAAGTIVDVAATVGASRLILGAPNRGALSSLLRGNIVREVSDLLPEDIELLVFA
jgi:nucleotide-binding universal stress UspA family protein